MSFVFLLVALTFLSPPDKKNMPIAKAYETCTNQEKPDKEKGVCLRKLAASVYENHTVPEIETAMRHAVDTKKLRWCHELMHYIGWEMYQDTQSMNNAFFLASGLCDSGMYHGIVEEYINQANLVYDAMETIEVISQHACTDAFSNQQIPLAMKGICYHGLGHGFMFITENNLPLSLQYCDLVPAGNRQACYAGTFMENIQSKQVGRFFNHPSKYITRDDPDYPCSILDDTHKDYCYRYQGVYNVTRTNADFKKSFELCKDVLPEYQDRCFWGVGGNIPAPDSSSSIAAEKCKLAIGVDPRAYEQCILGAMIFLIQIHLGDADTAAEFCEITKESHKEICYLAAGQALKNWVTPTETIQEKCGHFKKGLAQELCLSHRN